MSEHDRDRLADWLLSTRGRLVRVVVGTMLILIALGILRGGILGILLLILGAIPIASAAYGTLLIGPLLGRDTRGRKPEEQPDEADDDASDDDEEAESPGGDGAARGRGADEDSSEDDDASDAPETDPDWEAPPVARAERPEGQGPRTRDLRADAEEESRS